LDKYFDNLFDNHKVSKVLFIFDGIHPNEKKINDTEYKSKIITEVFLSVVKQKKYEEKVEFQRSDFESDVIIKDYSKDYDLIFSNDQGKILKNKKRCISIRV
jgi:hypothetical protein